MPDDEEEPPSLRWRTIIVGRQTLHVVTFIDRRRSNSQPGEFMFQAELEQLLFAQQPIGQTGAFYRLLQRAGQAGRALSLRRASVSQGLLSDAEFDELRGKLHSGFRVFTLVPMDAVEAALSTFGASESSDALLHALGFNRPPEWTVDAHDDESEQEGESEEDGEEEDEEMEDDDDEEEDDEEEEEGDDEEEDDDDNGEEGGSCGSANGIGGNDYPTTEEEDGPPVADDEPIASNQSAIEVTPTLEAQLTAFAQWRTSLINRNRKGKAVVGRTAIEDRRCILHFFAWLHHVKGVESPSFNLFASPHMGAVVQSFAEEKALSCKYSRVANLLGKLVSASRFTHAMLQTKTPNVIVDAGPVNQLIALHTQAMCEAREQAKFDAVKPPKAWLDWSACQCARLSAEQAVAACDAEAAVNEKLELVRDCSLLTLLTALPPDRVGVYRQLKLGSQLKIVGDTMQIDLSERGAHKTAAIFGPSRVTLTATVATRIRDLVDLDHLQHGECLFHGQERSSPLSPSAWTRLVQTTFKAYSGVALSPKDCRSSFVTWLKDGEHGDDTLRAAAQAMRHSSTMADSAAYDKHGTDRVVAAAVAAADAFANRFTL